MPKDSSVSYYQKKQSKISKGLVKGIKIFLIKKKKNSNNMVMIDMKTFLNINDKTWLTIEIIIIKCGKIKTLHNKRLVLKVLGRSFILVSSH